MSVRTRECLTGSLRQRGGRCMGPKGAHQALVGTCRVQLGWGWEGLGGAGLR